MSGINTNGLPQTAALYGSELFVLDTETAQGVAPQSGSISLAQLAIADKFYGNVLDKTTVAGSRYFTQVNVGAADNFTGIGVLIGGTGGTDKWLVELHDSNGNLVATSATAGATVGTANTWQQFAFTSAYAAPAGTYYLVVQTNGTTAKLATLNSPTNPLYTGSATGTFGTGAAITPPTSYTANVGPCALLY